VNTPASPTQWLYGLYVVVLMTGFVATIVVGSFRFRRLDASAGRRTLTLVSRNIASTASHRTVVTIAIAPLVAVDRQD
jgi:hypothetical protein